MRDNTEVVKAYATTMRVDNCRTTSSFLTNLGIIRGRLDTYIFYLWNIFQKSAILFILPSLGMTFWWSKPFLESSCVTNVWPLKLHIHHGSFTPIFIAVAISLDDMWFLIIQSLSPFMFSPVEEKRNSGENYNTVDEVSAQ